MQVTIIADASYCPHYRVAGYGYWVASARGKRGGSGAMRDLVVNNIAAEMMALANALVIAARFGLVLQGDTVLLQSDCMGALDRFEKVRPCNTAQEREVVDLLYRVRDKLGLVLQYRHVKGHTVGRTEARYVTNKLCDKRAKEAMRLARNKLRIKQIREMLE